MTTGILHAHSFTDLRVTTGVQTPGKDTVSHILFIHLCKYTVTVCVYTVLYRCVCVYVCVYTYSM